MPPPWWFIEVSEDATGNPLSWKREVFHLPQPILWSNYYRRSAALSNILYLKNRSKANAMDTCQFLPQNWKTASSCDPFAPRQPAVAMWLPLCLCPIEIETGVDSKDDSGSQGQYREERREARGKMRSEGERECVCMCVCVCVQVLVDLHELCHLTCSFFPSFCITFLIQQKKKKKKKNYTRRVQCMDKQKGVDAAMELANHLSAYRSYLLLSPPRSCWAGHEALESVDEILGDRMVFHPEASSWTRRGHYEQESSLSCELCPGTPAEIS